MADLNKLQYRTITANADRTHSARALADLVFGIFESCSSRHGKHLLVLALGLYLVSRVAVLYVMIPGDVKFYAQYAYQARAAQLQDSTIYQKFYSDGDLNRAIEYPPLVIEFFKWMSVFIPSDTAAEDFYRSFNRIFHVVFFSLDLLGLTILLAYVFKKNVKLSAIVLSVATYTFTGFILYPFLYSRLDLLLGQLVVGALILMVSHRRLEILSFAFLSFAVAFKLVPILLIPIWLIGSFVPVSANWAGLIWELAKKLALCGSIILLPWIFFAFWLGEDSVSFLQVHQSRGIHIESLWGTIAVLLSKLGVPVTVTSFRSYDVAFSLSPILTRLAVILQVSGHLVIASIYFLRVFPFLMTTQRGICSVAQKDPNCFKLAILTSLVFSLTVSQVFSPQYLLWFVPFAMVIPWEFSWGRVSHAMLLLLAFLTFLIVPKFYVSDVLPMTWLGAGLLTLRNAGMVFWAGILLTHLIRHQSAVQESAREML